MDLTSKINDYISKMNFISKKNNSKIKEVLNNSLNHFNSMSSNTSMAADLMPFLNDASALSNRDSQLQHEPIFKDNTSPEHYLNSIHSSTAQESSPSLISNTQ